jgi:hypothetical protein
MLTVSDSGCRLHQQRHFTFMGEEAEVIEGVLLNLPQTGVCLFYLCEHGYSHRLSFNEHHINILRLPKSTRRRAARYL